MKKLLSVILMVTLVLSLVACGGGSKDTPPSNVGESNDNNAEIKDSVTQVTSAEVKPAVNGVLTISIGNAAIVVNGTSVPTPYRLGDLEAAGVPKDESRKEIELASGDFFSPNLFLYIQSPSMPKQTTALLKPFATIDRIFLITSLDT